MKNVDETFQQALSGFIPTEKAGEPIEGQEMVSIPLATFKRLLPTIKGYEIDGQTILIYTNQEFDFECDMGSSRFDFLYWLREKEGFALPVDAENYLDGLDSGSRNELAEEWANENTDRWEVVEP